MQDNELTLNLINYKEISNEFASINENINNESNKLKEILKNKAIENGNEVNQIDLIIKQRETELDKLKKL